MNKTIELGMSIYFSSTFLEIKNLLEEMVENKMEYIFSSLNIKEIDVEEEKLYKTIELAKDLGLKLIIDVNEMSLKKYPLDKLKKAGLSHIRIDDGLSLEEIYDLSEDFTIVLNASTILDEEMDKLKSLGMNFKKLIACHNYYPKEYTGLSMEYMATINRHLKEYGMYTMAFIPGDDELRGPIYDALPTVEDQRRQRPIQNILEMEEYGYADIVLVGDIGISEQSKKDIKLYKEEIIPIKSKYIQKEYENILRDKTFKDRVDSSKYMIRVQALNKPGKIISQDIKPYNTIKRKVGYICLSNTDFKRYMGQVEIVKKEIPKDERVNIIGEISDTDIPLLKYIKRGRKFKIV